MRPAELKKDVKDTLPTTMTLAPDDGNSKEHVLWDEEQVAS